MKRGDIVRAAGKGAYAGKPRPFLVVQSDAFLDVHSSVSLCPITSTELGDDLFRIPVGSGDGTGLRTPSEIQIDKVQSVRRQSIDGVIGTAGPAVMGQVDAALRRWFDL